MRNVNELYHAWVQYPSHAPAIRQELEAIADDPQAIADRFYRDLEFGTGGLRGIIGAGTNRMNVYTVRRATLGLARYLEASSDRAKVQGVVVGYDSRHMSDEFALETGLVLAAAGFRVYVFDHLCPTPELSFAVRELGAAAGVMITASHNPPAYNGYKVYGPDGCQILPDVAAQITARIEGVQDFFHIPRLAREDAERNGLLQWLGADWDERYCRRVVESLAVPSLTAADREQLHIVYTPLHGTGNVPVRTALGLAGYRKVSVVSEQERPDGDFPTAKSPNPEEPEALALALRQAEQEGADIALGTDPDADRVGVAVRDRDGSYRLLTGNQIGGLLVDFLLKVKQEAGERVDDRVVFKTIVTSELGASVARRHGVEVEDTLTGFKYIGARVTEREQAGSKRLLFGYEESYGYLASDIVRDKDAVQGCLLVAEMAAWYKRRGMTLLDALEALYREVGYFEEQLISRTLPGQNGLAQIQGLMEELRKGGIRVHGLELLAVEDYLASRRTWLGSPGDSPARTEPLTLPKSDVLKYLFRGGCWLAVRPSGTEPKIKVYLGAVGETKESCQQALAAMREAVDAFLKQAEPVGQTHG
ncbi:MAG: phospho-sugar mutase [Alicyclobacillaceae bacterium]|nr:phospho-sugar mutase [Alicyclobacillaceae bacterium]